MGTTRKIAELIGPERRSRWALIGVLGTVASVLEVVGAMLVFTVAEHLVSPEATVSLPIIGPMRSVGTVTTAGDATSAYVLLAMILAAFFVIRGALFFYQSFLQHRLAQLTAASFSERLVGTYLQRPYAAHVRTNRSETVRNVTESVDVIANSVLFPMMSTISDTLLVIGVLTVLLFQAPAVTAVLIAALAAVCFVVIRSMRRRLTRLGELSETMAAESLGWLTRGIEGFRDLRLMNLENYFQGEFARRKARLARAQYMHASAEVLPRVAIETAFVLVLLLVSATAMANGVAADETIAVAALITYAVFRLLPALSRIVAAVNSLRFAAPAVDAVYTDLVDETLSHPRAPTTRRPLVHGDSIVLRDVSFAYPEAQSPALDAVGIDIRMGSLVFVVGPTGSGKSTLLDVIAGLLDPSRGSVRVNGCDVRDDLDTWWKGLAFVTERPVIFDDTIARNVAATFEGDLDLRAVTAAINTVGLSEVVTTLPGGLETKLGETALRLSRGQYQRLALARCLYRMASIVILDEGTSGLDPTSERRVLSALRDAPTRTVIASTQRFDNLHLADAVVFLERGRVSDAGSYDEVLARSKRFRLFVGSNLDPAANRPENTTAPSVGTQA